MAVSGWSKWNDVTLKFSNKVKSKSFIDSLSQIIGLTFLYCTLLHALVNKLDSKIKYIMFTQALGNVCSYESLRKGPYNLISFLSFKTWLLV